MADWIVEIVKTQGVVATIALVSVWWSRKDYQGVCKELNNLNEFIRIKFIEIVRDSQKQIDTNSEVLKDLRASNQKMVDVLKVHQEAMERCVRVTERVH